MPIADFNGRVRRRLAFLAEIIFISALILVTRCANYGDVFFGGHINFIEADCYARMTRARICFEHPGTVVRRHDFENFPTGTSPHTTAPFDYLIVAIAAALKPLSSNALDLAGALVSPLLSMVLGIFLCWWSRKARLRFRWGLLILYAVSPILAHGFALGRPDHQSLLIALIAIALCAEWKLAEKSSKSWSIVSAAGWAMALWVSLYEPLMLFAMLIVFRFRSFVSRERRMGWIVFAAIVTIMFMVERRIPQWPNHEFARALKNWSGTIGELSQVSLDSPIWFSWCGWLLLLTPILFWPKRDRRTPLFVIALLVATFGLTLWQARWAYFFVMIFALTVPQLLSALRKPIFAAVLFVMALFPIAQSWDGMLGDENLGRRAENKMEQMELRAIASGLDGPFLAPWWFSPAIAYWSRQSGVAGSSHESIRGVVETAKFFAMENREEITEFIDGLNVRWIVIYDADRLAQNSSRILGHEVSKDALCYFFDYRASEVPRVLQLTAQTGHFKLFRVSQS